MTPEIFHSLHWNSDNIYTPSGHIPLAIDYAHQVMADLHHHHNRMHLSIQCIIQIFKEPSWAPNINQITQKDISECRPCNLDKDITSTAGPSEKHHVYHPGQVFTLETMGPLPT